MGFKFLTSEQDQYGINYVPEPNEEIHTSILYYRSEVNLDTLGEIEYDNLLRRERIKMIESFWMDGRISQEIISQDNNGFTLRTEIII